MFTRTNMKKSVYSFYIFLQNIGGSFNKDLRGILKTSRSSREIVATRDKMDSVVGNGNRASTTIN